MDSDDEDDFDNDDEAKKYEEAQGKRPVMRAAVTTAASFFLPTAEVEQQEQQEDEERGEGNGEQKEQEQEQGPATPTLDPPDVEADLDDEGQVDDDNTGPGVMKEFLRAVHGRLKAETRSDFVGEKWLLDTLNNPGDFVLGSIVDVPIEKSRFGSHYPVSRLPYILYSSAGEAHTPRPKNR